MKFILSQQPVELTVSVWHSKHLFVTWLSTNGSRRLQPIGDCEVTWSGALCVMLYKGTLGIFHSWPWPVCVPALFLVQGPCDQHHGLASPAYGKTFHWTHMGSSRYPVQDQANSTHQTTDNHRAQLPLWALLGNYLNLAQARHLMKLSTWERM